MKKFIPNILTCLNLLNGACACIFAAWNMPMGSLAFLAIAFIFDCIDGLAARKLDAVSPIGKELDSLADVVSFGLTPSIVLFAWCHDKFTGNISFLAFFPLLIVAASALRLAKFDIDQRQTENFLGMPTPANALMITSATAYATVPSAQGGANGIALAMSVPWVVPTISLLLSILLVSELPFFSLKFKTWDFRSNMVRYIYLMIIALFAAIALICKVSPILVTFICFAFYLILCLALCFFGSLSHKQKAA